MTCAADARCYDRVQRNRFDGRSPSPASHVRFVNAIEPRLVDALTELARRDPTGGWGRFLTHGTIRWDRIVVAGHSQGGSHAAYIAHIRPVRGALLFGSPALSWRGHHAAWIDTPSRTPANRIYAVAHAEDALRARIIPSWSALGIPGATHPERLSESPTTGDPHAILISSDLPPGYRGHTMVAKNHTPLSADRRPAMTETWRWMLGRFRVRS